VFSTVDTNKMLPCPWNKYYSKSTEQCEWCTTVCKTDIFSNECVYKCPGFRHLLVLAMDNTRFLWYRAYA